MKTLLSWNLNVQYILLLLEIVLTWKGRAINRRSNSTYWARSGTAANKQIWSKILRHQAFSIISVFQTEYRKTLAYFFLFE
jgi:hypothetical protein